VGTVPPDAESLLAARPDDFVGERTALARALRAEGRSDDADAVASLRKPPAVVLAVNRAARDRPKAARDAGDAAARLARAQLQGERENHEKAARELDQALELLAEVALAQLSRGDRPPTETSRVRVRDLLRAAVSDESTRDLLVRGVLTTEVESAGFGAFAGMPLPKRKRGGVKRQSGEQRPGADTSERKRELRERIRKARSALGTAEEDIRAAERRRDELAKTLADLEAELGRL
jgi:hypothetical protein